jgi:RNA polymerase sigma factor (sigma-70 family)
MAIEESGAVVRQLRTLFNLGTIGTLSDGQLLERFATHRGESAELAFAAIVERHGPMVLRVCQSVLGDLHDAQDAFQATFLVLVRKARGLWVRDSLGPWLHQVAFRTASCARSNAARRRRHEERAARDLPEGRHDGGDGLAQVLHEEIERLPERFRAPVVLCDLQGCTHEQAARHLGWPIGTVKSRQARARERLRAQLTRRGMAPGAAQLPAALRREGPTAPLPPELVDSTTRAAASAGTWRALVPGSAASLSQEVLRSMSIARWLKTVALLIALGATGSGFGMLGRRDAANTPAQQAANPSPPPFDEMPVHTVKPGTLKVSVVERGVLEAGLSNDVYCNVEGRTVILTIKPEGSAVKKGEIMCELDSAALKDALVNQVIATNTAEGEYENAKLAREAAEIAVVEFEKGTLKHDLDAVGSQSAAARAAIQKAEQRLERTQRARQRLEDLLTPKAGTRTASDIMAELDIEDRLEAARQTVENETRSLELARAKREIIEKYTSPRKTRQFKVELASKQSDELAKKATWELSRSKARKLERQIAACTLLAPSDGMLVYANDPVRVFGRNTTQIEEGAMVRERQKIFSIPDLSRPFLVNTKVRESKVKLIAAKVKARIKVDAFADLKLTGVVLDVAPLPDPFYSFASDRKVYTTRVRIQERVPGLRPGMTAEVELLVDERADVLTVPIRALVEFDGKNRVAVKRAAGVFEWRVVKLGAADDEFVEIKEGLHKDELVMMNPTALLTDEQKREADRKAAPKPRAKSAGR